MEKDYLEDEEVVDNKSVKDEDQKSGYTDVDNGFGFENPENDKDSAEAEEVKSNLTEISNNMFDVDIAENTLGFSTESFKHENAQYFSNTPNGLWYNPNQTPFENLKRALSTVIRQKLSITDSYGVTHVADNTPESMAYYSMFVIKALKLEQNAKIVSGNTTLNDVKKYFHKMADSKKEKDSYENAFYKSLRIKKENANLVRMTDNVAVASMKNMKPSEKEAFLLKQEDDLGPFDKKFWTLPATATEEERNAMAQEKDDLLTDAKRNYAELKNIHQNRGFFFRIFSFRIYGRETEALRGMESVLENKCGLTRNEINAINLTNTKPYSNIMDRFFMSIDPSKTQEEINTTDMESNRRNVALIHKNDPVREAVRNEYKDAIAEQRKAEALALEEAKKQAEEDKKTVYTEVDDPIRNAVNESRKQIVIDEEEKSPSELSRELDQEIAENQKKLKEYKEDDEVELNTDEVEKMVNDDSFLEKRD